MKHNSFYLLPLYFLLLLGCKKGSDSASQGNPNTPPQNSETYLRDTTVSYPMGLIPSTYAELVSVPILDTATIPALRKFEKATLEKSYDLSPIILKMPIPRHQGKLLGDCTAWTVGYSMMSYLYANVGGNTDYKSDDNVFSPVFIYNQTSTGPKSGISLFQALQFVKHHGCCKWSDMPEDDNTLYTEQPSKTALTNSTHFKITNYFRVDKVDINYLKSLIMNLKSPLIFSCWVDSGFVYDYPSSWEVRKNTKVWKALIHKKDRHSMVVIGYDDALHSFKVMNSWGTKWGPWPDNDSRNDGFCWIDYNLFTKVLITNLEGVPGIPEIFVGILKSPKISTSAPCSITETTAIMGGEITNSENNSIISRGICWSKVENPTIADNKIVDKATGIGAFTCNVSDLAVGTSYHVRAYSITGVGTTYGNDIGFKTAGTGASGQPSKDPNCKENYTGDYCFQNNTSSEIELILRSSPSKKNSYTAPFTSTLKPGQNQCFFDVPAGVAGYEIKTPATYSGYSNGSAINSDNAYYAQGYLYVDNCRVNTFFINRGIASYSSNDPLQTNGNTNSKTPNCNENYTGDYYFQNSTDMDLNITLVSSPSKVSSYTSPFSCTIQPGQQQCFFDVPAGPAKYEIKTPATYSGYGNDSPPKTYSAEGSLYVDQCKANIFVIK